MRTLERHELTTLGRGYGVLGSGGGGTTTMWQLILAESPLWPLTVFGVEDLPDETPCVAVAFGGSTLLLGERIPGDAPFAPLVDAAERWTGVRARAVCALEGAGLNGLSPFSLADELAVVDADLMGRALPRLDQLTLFVDRVPGTVTICSTGADGVVVIDTARAADVEKLARSAIVQAGGMSAVLVAGFTVGDLREHAVTGGLDRAMRLGRAFEHDGAAPSLPELADALAARLLGVGRVMTVETTPDDPFASTIEIRADDGALLRVIARSETLAFMRDGQVESVTPEIIVTVDSLSRSVLQVDGFTIGRHVAILALPAPEWWTQTPERLATVSPAAYGLSGLDGPCGSDGLPGMGGTP
ncbi:DUF917 domain-containing protein [Labedella phragmitis]|uniref:DUF917 domain-containing protein n=2 Tax=Labedella TaxID=390250 RepID=A0A3S4DT06_9MICO|nr:DUF917 domain-containing protein [Labedella phragmitis]RWZ55454.1 DUF917 domain-containing protein [Labedella populi]